MKRINSLDGIRALSIIMVLLGHASETMPEVINHNIIFRLLSNSSLGVKIFFVISGYLITRLLLKEKAKTGHIDVKDFYIRRIFRIFPVFYLYIAITVLIKIFLVKDIFTNYSLAGYAALYLWNYQVLFHPIVGHDNGYWFFGHFWSLSMEEQFYLIWPLVFINLTPISLKKIVLGIIFLMPFLRVITYFIMPNTRGQIGMMLHTGGDSILVGCLGALIENTENLKEKWMKIIQSKYLIWCIAVFMFIISPLLSMRFKGNYNLILGISLNNICIMFLIFWCINVESKISRFLNAKYVMHVGVLSYSLYIWQQLFLTKIYTSWVNKFPQNLLLVFIVATFSYYIIEKPILGLKKRLKAE